MITNQPITIFADDLTRQALEIHTKRLGLEDFCQFENHMENVVIIRYGTDEALFDMPVRIGQIIDQINRFKVKAAKTHSARLALGSHTLNVNSGTFRHCDDKDGEKAIQLTEKEVELLCYLHKNKDRTVPREELLNAIWGYAENVETHTLETHIYRLRQKIEKKPAEPLLLKKEDNGYLLSS